MADKDTLQEILKNSQLNRLKTRNRLNSSSNGQPKDMGDLLKQQGQRETIQQIKNSKRKSSSIYNSNEYSPTGQNKIKEYKQQQVIAITPKKFYDVNGLSNFLDRVDSDETANQNDVYKLEKKSDSMETRYTMNNPNQYDRFQLQSFENLNCLENFYFQDFITKQHFWIKSFLVLEDYLLEKQYYEILNKIQLIDYFPEFISQDDARQNIFYKVDYNSIKQIHENKITNQQKWKQDELIFLIKEILKIILKFQENNILINDITPSNIAIKFGKTLKIKFLNILESVQFFNQNSSLKEKQIVKLVNQNPFYPIFYTKFYTSKSVISKKISIKQDEEVSSIFKQDENYQKEQSEDTIQQQLQNDNNQINNSDKINIQQKKPISVMLQCINNQIFSLGRIIQKFIIETIFIRSSIKSEGTSSSNMSTSRTSNSNIRSNQAVNEELLNLNNLDRFLQILQNNYPQLEQIMKNILSQEQQSDEDVQNIIDAIIQLQTEYDYTSLSHILSQNLQLLVGQNQIKQNNNYNIFEELHFFQKLELYESAQKILVLPIYKDSEYLAQAVAFIYLQLGEQLEATGIINQCNKYYSSYLLKAKIATIFGENKQAQDYFDQIQKVLKIQEEEEIILENQEGEGSMGQQQNEKNYIKNNGNLNQSGENKNNNNNQSQSQGNDFQNQKLNKEVFDIEYEDYLQYLAHFLWDQEQFEQSSKIFNECLHITQKKNGSYNVKTLHLLEQIARLLLNSNKLEDSFQLASKCLEIKKELFGSSSQLLVNSYLIIGEYWVKKGISLEGIKPNEQFYDEALENYYKALDIKSLQYTQDVQQLALILMSIGEVNELQLDYQNALKMFQQAKVIYKRKYGENSENYINCQIRIANLYRGNNYLEEAQEIYIHIYEKLQQKRKSLLSAQCLYGLACIDYEQQEFQEAITKHTLALQMRQEIKHNFKELLSDSFTQLGILYSNRGVKLYEKSVEFHKKALQVRNEIYGVDHEYVADSKASIAYVYMLMQKYDEALEYFASAEKIVYEIHEQHWKLEVIYDSQAEILFRKGNYLQCQQLSYSSLFLKEEIYKKNSVQYADQLMNIARFCKQQQAMDYEEKMKNYEHAKEKVKQANIIYIQIDNTEKSNKCNQELQKLNEELNENCNTENGNQEGNGNNKNKSLPITLLSKYKSNSQDKNLMNVKEQFNNSLQQEIQNGNSFQNSSSQSNLTSKQSIGSKIGKNLASSSANKISGKQAKNQSNQNNDESISKCVIF